MAPADETWVNVDEQGRLILPEDVMKRHGIRPGAQIRLQESPGSLHLDRPGMNISKVYIELTSRCNLNCRTCIRNSWQDQQGDMSAETWTQVIESLKGLPSRPDVFFGGFGEPLLLPNIAELVTRAKTVAGKVELITNGILLDDQCSRRLIDAGLDKLWVSVDGATPENYADVRIGATLPSVLGNITRFNLLRDNRDLPEIGISFVAMRRNIDDLPILLRKASSLGVSHFMVTNVFPYTDEMRKEMLYTRSVDGVDSVPSPWAPRVDLPLMDMNEYTRETFFQTMRNRRNIRLNGQPLGQDRGHCPFIERGSVSISWNGDVSPCLALMHPYQTYLNDQPRSVKNCVYGNVTQQRLLAIWEAKEYFDFRKRVEAFDFSPCISCGGCSWSEANQEDCFANPFPTCGGCLWAQGVIQCP